MSVWWLLRTSAILRSTSGYRPNVLMADYSQSTRRWAIGLEPTRHCGSGGFHGAVAAYMTQWQHSRKCRISRQPAFSIFLTALPVQEMASASTFNPLVSKSLQDTASASTERCRISRQPVLFCRIWRQPAPETYWLTPYPASTCVPGVRKCWLTSNRAVISLCEHAGISLQRICEALACAFPLSFSHESKCRTINPFNIGSQGAEPHAAARCTAAPRFAESRAIRPRAIKRLRTGKTAWPRCKISRRSHC